jgi:membrane-associated phospholipid phosphatase
MPRKLPNLSKSIIPKKNKRLIYIFSEILLGVIISLAFLIFFAKIAREMIANDTVKFDINFSILIYNLRSPILTQIMIFITNLGSEFTLVVASISSIIFAWKKYRQEAILFLFALLSGLLINITFKDIIQRPRPNIAPIISENSYSFPSGHAMNSFIFYSLVVYFIYHFTRNRKYVTISAIIAALLISGIGLSRIYLGVHYPSDIIAGYFAGFWWVTTIILIQKTLIFYEIMHKQPRIMSKN